MFTANLSRRLARTLDWPIGSRRVLDKQIEYVEALNKAEREGAERFSDLPADLQRLVKQRESHA